MAKNQLPKIAPGDSIYKVLSAEYQDQIRDSLGRFNQITGGRSLRATGTAELVPHKPDGPEKVLTAELQGDLPAGLGSPLNYATAAAAIQVFDYELGSPEAQHASRSFALVAISIALKTITIDGQHASLFSNRHEVWLRETESPLAEGTRDGTYTVEQALDIAANNQTEIVFYEDIPSILDPLLGLQAVEGTVWLWTPFQHMNMWRTLDITDYRMVVNRTTTSFFQGDMIYIFWVDGEYIVLGSTPPSPDKLYIGMALDSIGGMYSYAGTFTDPDTGEVSNVSYYEAGIGQVQPFKLDVNQTYPDREIFKYDISDLVDGSKGYAKIIISGNVINHFGTNIDIRSFPTIPPRKITVENSSSLSGTYEVLAAEYNSSGNTTEITTAEEITAALDDSDNRIIDGNVVMPGWSRMHRDLSSVYVVNRSNRAIRSGAIVHYMYDGHEYRVISVEC
jgi:hypothetical protein